MKFAFISWGFIEIVIFLFVLILGLVVYDRRYKKRNSSDSHVLPPDFQPTPEVFTDPKDGMKYRVYYNARTGEREYVPEK